MKKFFWQDKTGRGVTAILAIDQMLELPDDIDWNDHQLHEWVNEAEPGDKWEDSTSRFIRIE